MAIPVFNPAIRRKEMDAVLTCLVSEQIGPGENNRTFVEKLGLHIKHAGGVCFREPQRALEALFKTFFPLPEVNEETGEVIRPRVLISALAPSYYYDAIAAVHFEPVIVDVDINTALPLQEAVEAALPTCNLILLNYPLGNFPNYEFYSQIEVPIIEDVSCSIGVKVGEEGVGTLGTYVLVGNEADHLVTAGGGAVVLANNRSNAIKLKKTVQELNETILMSDMNAAMGMVQVSSLNERLEKRQNYFNLFLSQLQKGGHKTLSFSGGVESLLYSFPVVVDVAMDQVVAYANKKKVETAPAFSNVVLDKLPADCKDYPNALSLKLRTILFPMYELLGNANADLVSKVLLSLP